jgi:hypothetical protein
LFKNSTEPAERGVLIELAQEPFEQVAQTAQDILNKMV